MKTTEKDILMICKGHYNYEQHENIESALDAYYRKHYGISKEELPVLSYKFMLQLWFYNCVETFLQPDTIGSFRYYVIMEETFAERSNGCTDFYEVLYYRITKWLQLLSVKNSDGSWKIDLSDYDGIDYII